MGDENENLDINDYTIDELKDLLEITELRPENINEKISESIQQFSEEGNSDMITFLNEAKKKLMEAYKSQIPESWLKNEYPSSDKNTKITSRYNKIQEFDGAQQQERLNINQTKQLPHAQGEINPTLRNVTTKIVSIDSRYRNNNVPALKSQDYTSGGIWDASQFSANLSENLNKVMLLRLYSVQIPYTWYNVPDGSKCFMYNEDMCSIPSGNYDIAELSTAITAACAPLTLTVNRTTLKVTLNNLVAGDTVTFFKTEGFPDCNGSVSMNQINNTLGWILGFREACYTVADGVTTLTAEAPIDLNGPKYLLLYLDDFTHNRVNKGIVTIGDTETKLDLPKYHLKTGNITTQGGQLSNVKPECEDDILEINNCPPETLPVKTPFFTQDLPRTITQAQQYTINEIIKNRKNNPRLKLTPPNPSNILGIIPVRTNNLSFGQILVESANTLTFNTRRYFGPVDIERIEVKLLDDKGNLLNLNGADWSFSLFSEHLYQY